MAKRIIEISVNDEYVVGSGVVIGAAGADESVILRVAFGDTWAGLNIYATFRDSKGESPTVELLMPSMLVLGEAMKYDVVVPAAATKYAGKMSLVFSGFAVSEVSSYEIKTGTEENIKLVYRDAVINTTNAYFRVLPSDFSALDVKDHTEATVLEKVLSEINGFDEKETERRAAETERESAEAERKEIFALFYEDYSTGKFKGEKGDPGSVNVVDGPGNSETDAMSQKAVTDEFGKYFTTEKSINLFDKSQPRESGLIMGNGQIISNEIIKIATIPVEIGKTYTYPIYYSHFGYNAAYNVACYDKDMVYLGWITGTPTEDNALLTVTIGTKVYSPAVYAEVEAEVAFVKVNISDSIYVDVNKDTFMFVEGSEYPDTYHAYFADKIILNPSVEVKNAESDDVLRGKTIVFTGDSICAGTSDESGVRGWAQRIGEGHSMIWQNKGINGATITSGVTGSSGCIADTDFGEAPDYIILEGGTNDADLIGSADNFTPEKFGSYTLGQYNAEFDKTTFCGAVEHLFKRVTTDYAGAKIGFIIAHKMGYATTAAHYDAATSRRRKYFETIIELCKKWGIPYIDLWEGCYLCPMNPAHNTANTNLMYVGDYQHLAKRGYDYITPMIEKWMETL